MANNKIEVWKNYRITQLVHVIHLLSTPEIRLVKESPFFLQDLCDRLYDICDNRKELAEKERQSVMNEGWLEDRLGLLTNFYITLMQAEVDRYQDTVRLLKDYYIGMEGISLISVLHKLMQRETTSNHP